MTRKQIGPNEWYIVQQLTQRGTAEVYTNDGDGDYTDETLIEVRPFTVNEKTKGTVDYLANWYHRNSLTYVEFWDYNWHIGGIYHYWGDCKDGLGNSIIKYWVKGLGWVQMYP